MTLFFKNANPHPDWYRVYNPAGLDLEDVTDAYSNSLIGLISVLFTQAEKMPAGRAEITLIGATLHISIFESRRRAGLHYLSIPQGIELSRKIQAQVLRAYERYLAEA